MGVIFEATFNSGQPVSKIPGEGGAGNLVAGALEGSNVDYAQEIVDSIIASRMIEANIKTIKIQDEMLGDMIDIKT